MADPELDAALQAGRLADVAGVLDARELQAGAADPLLPPWPAAAHMLAHMLNGSLDDARFVYKRLPPASKSAPGVPAALTLLRALWSRDVTGAWRALKEGDWPPGPPAALAAALADSLRASAADAVGRLYSRLSVQRAAEVLGLDAESGVAAVAAQRGWSLDGGIVSIPPPPDAAADDGADVPPPPPQVDVSEDELKTLAEYVLQLESAA